MSHDKGMIDALLDMFTTVYEKVFKDKPIISPGDWEKQSTIGVIGVAGIPDTKWYKDIPDEYTDTSVEEIVEKNLKKLYNLLPPEQWRTRSTHIRYYSKFCDEEHRTYSLEKPQKVKKLCTLFHLCRGVCLTTHAYFSCRLWTTTNGIKKMYINQETLRRQTRTFWSQWRTTSLCLINLEFTKAMRLLI